MIMKTYRYRSLLFFLLLATAGCKTPALPVLENNAISLPPVYQQHTDTSTAVLPRWENFFNDTGLLSLIRTGIAHNPDLQVALQRIQAAQADLLQAKGLLLPMVNGSILSGLRRFGQYTMDGAGNRTTDIQPGKQIPADLPDYFVGLQAGWELDLWGKLKHRKQSALARFFATQEGKNLLVTQLVAAVATAYYDLLATDEMLRIVDETILLREKAYELVKVQKESAMSNELAVKQFGAQLNNLLAFRGELVQQAVQTENTIHLLTGNIPGSINRSKQLFDTGRFVYLKTGLPSALLRQRPDIRQAEWNLLAAKAELKAARAAFLPAFTITGSLGFQAFRPDLLVRAPESVAYGLIGGLTAPLVNRTAIKAGFQKAGAAQLEAYYQYQKTILNGYVEVYNEIRRAENLGEVFSQRYREAATLQESIDIAAVLFKAGRASYLEVLVTQQNALQAKLSLVETKRKQLLTTISLYRALGGGWQ